jgi:hypothetical protein
MVKTPTHLLTIFFLFTTISPSNLLSREVKNNINEINIWLYGGFGVASMKYEGSQIPSINTGVSSEINRHMLTIRFFYSEEMFPSLPHAHEHMLELGALYSWKLLKGEIGYISTGGGVSYVKGIKKGDLLEQTMFYNIYKKENYKTVGFPFVMDLGLTVSSVFGFCLSSYLHINRHKQFVGVSWLIMLGKLRDKY